MARRYSIVSWIPCILACSALSAAAADTVDTSFHYHATEMLGTSMDLRVVASTQAEADKAHDLVVAEITRLSKILSTRDASSDLAKVNAGTTPVKVAPEVIAVLKQYDQWETRSKGAFSGKLGGLVALWKDAAATGKMPEKSRVASEVSKTKAPLWKIDEQAGTVQRLSDQQINIDSLGKGFVVSKAAAAGKAAPGVRGLLLDVGGDITALGTSSRTAIEEWKVGVADPAHPAENAAPLVTVRIAGKSIATSGSYARNYSVGGTKLSHILDPRSGYPVDSADAPGGKHSSLVIAATVIANDNDTANALAASLNVLTPDEGVALVGQVAGAEAMIVLEGGKIIRTAGFSRYEVSGGNVASSSSVTDAAAWPTGAQVSFTIQQNTNIRDRPYMAIWIENAEGKHVATITEWGNNNRWVNSLSTWGRAVNWDNNLLRAVSRATRPAGKYTFTWDGKDQAGKPVAPGTYKVCVEFAYERNGHSVGTATIVCGDQNASSSIARTQHFDEIPVTFSAKAN